MHLLAGMNGCDATGIEKQCHIPKQFRAGLSHFKDNYGQHRLVATDTESGLNVAAIILTENYRTSVLVHYRVRYECGAIEDIKSLKAYARLIGIKFSEE
jgi:hypothetical protein